jgi:geranylgeranyl pyrophosphate synthase
MRSARIESTPTGTTGGSTGSPRAAWSRAEALLPDLAELLRDQTDADGVLGEAARHHLGSGGKVFRARLLLACADVLGTPTSTALPAAAACELLHNASLVHDDIQDGDPLRRGRPAVWRVFGRDVALCLGDHFIARAFALLARMPDHAAGLVALFADTVTDAVRGQLAESRADPLHFPDPEAYRRMAAGKSGALFALPAVAACVLAGRDDLARPVRDVLELHGVAYQIKDDLLDVTVGKEGRPAGSDLAAGKTNAVLVMLLDADPGLRSAFAADLERGMNEAGRARWLARLTEPRAIARTVAEHEAVLARAETAATRLPAPLRNCLRLGLGRIVALDESSTPAAREVVS